MTLLLDQLSDVNENLEMASRAVALALNQRRRVLQAIRDVVDHVEVERAGGHEGMFASDAQYDDFSQWFYSEFERAQEPVPQYEDLEPSLARRTDEDGNPIDEEYAMEEEDFEEIAPDVLAGGWMEEDEQEDQSADPEDECSSPFLPPISHYANIPSPSSGIWPDSGSDQLDSTP